MTAEPPADYRVGYGKPPLHTRFKKGNRGNPGGRPRRARNLKTLLQEALEERVVVVTEDGRRRKVAKRELERRAPTEPAERPPLDEADQAVVENLLARLRAP